jgi:large subunit ribosomal protein L10
MSKMVKDLITDHLKHRIGDANHLFVVNIVGLDAIKNSTLRKQLREKGMQMMVVKNTLARRATEGTVLAPAFASAVGTSAVIWGDMDAPVLAKEIVRLQALKEMAPFEAKGGVVDGSALSAAEVAAVAKWPTREEQLSLLLGQILSPGALLVSQLGSIGGALASQIKQHSEGEESGGEAAGSEAAGSEAAGSEAAGSGEAAGGEAAGGETAAAPSA